MKAIMSLVVCFVIVSQSIAQEESTEWAVANFDSLANSGSLIELQFGRGTIHVRKSANAISGNLGSLPKGASVKGYLPANSTVWVIRFDGVIGYVADYHVVETDAVKQRRSRVSEIATRIQEEERLARMRAREQKEKEKMEEFKARQKEKRARQASEEKKRLEQAASQRNKGVYLFVDYVNPERRIVLMG